MITAYVYPDAEYEETCKLIDETTTYALTGAVYVICLRNRLKLTGCYSFSEDRAALLKASALLRSAAGNFYLNE